MKRSRPYTNDTALCVSLVDVGIVFYPSLLLNVMANELKRVLRAWVPPPEPVGISVVVTNDLLSVLKPLSAIVTLVSASACFGKLLVDAHKGHYLFLSGADVGPLRFIQLYMYVLV